SEQPNSTCNGGTLPGMLQRVYQKIVVLDSCDTWTITWGIANRNASINLDPAGNTYYFAVTAQLNSAVAPDNNSPVFNAQPIPYVCVNQLVNYSFGVSETDGDSLVYSFAAPLGGGAGAVTPLTYQPGYTIQQPLPGITLDPVTGLLVFTPTVLGAYVVVVQVDEYRDGILIGHVKRDIQFIVRSCINTAPDINAGQITNVNGDAVQTSPFAIEMCEGNTFSFTSTFTDSDPADTLNIISNINTVLPGSTISTSGTNPLVVNISWTAPAGSSGQNNAFSITVNDGACPIPGIQNFVYNIEVVPSTFIIPSTAVICGADSLQLEAIGGTDFIWYDLSGNQITPGPTFSCNNCPNPVVKPPVTTSYVVVSNLSSTCVNRDTIVVSIAPDFSAIALASDTILCLGDTIQFNLQTSNGGAPYTFSWLPAAIYNNNTISNPLSNFSTPGTYNAIVNVTSAQGCLRSDTITINVVPSPVITIQPYGPYCANAAPVDLDYSVSNPNYVENWGGPGITNSQTGLFNPTIAGVGAHNITLTVSVPNAACTATQSTIINVINTPDATITAPDTLFCSVDSPVQLSGATTGGTWSSIPGGFITSGLFNPASAPTGETLLIYSFVGACPNSDTVSVTVNQTPPTPIISQNQINCNGVNLPLGAITANGIAGGTVSWYLSSSLSGLISTGNTYQGDFFTEGTIYAYDSINGCVSDTAFLLINFNPAPTAQFTVDPAVGSGTIPLQVVLNNGSTGQNEWNWNFGDGSAIDTAFSPTHIYTAGGIFRIILTVTNDFGCTDTTGFTIIAIEETIIPNIFSPNGDGSNDEFYFKIDANSLKSFKATIFDRWGKKVIDFASVKDRWDGGNYPAGTYYYTIEATDINDQPFKETHGFFKMMK
ncbi:MAG: PKD domain-containing protein, partial [Bacteroidota bacterium]